MKLLLPLFTALILCAPGAAQDEAPSSAEVKKMLESYFELDAAADSERSEILQRLALVEMAEPSVRTKWMKEIAKHSSKHVPELPRKSGEYYFWKNPDRGFYIIGGETRKPQGLLIGMHGGGVDSGDAHSSAGAMRDAAKELKWLGIFPQVLEKTELGWTDSGTEEWIMELIHLAIVTHEIDPNRVYLSGHSMGGYGSWVLGAHHADKVAALAPSAGAPSPVYDEEGKVSEIQSGVIPNLRNVPMVVYQSRDDPRVRAIANQAAVAQVGKMKKRWGGYADFEYWEVDNRQHGYPEGGMLALLSKIKGYTRDVHQAKIVWQPTLAWKRQFYWLYWPKPRRNAIIEASFDKDRNAFAVRCFRKMEGAEILLSPEMVDLDREVIVEFNGKEVARKQPAPNLGCVLEFFSASDSERIYCDRISLD